MNRLAPRVGILGGTFDPVHRAHVALAHLFVERLALDRLLVMPAGSPWQKDGVVASPRARAHMLRLAFTGAPAEIEIDERELHRSGPTYSVDTLGQLRAELGEQAVLVLLMGSDQLVHLQTWHRWRELFDLANLAIAGRPGFSMDEASIDPEVRAELAPRRVTPDQGPSAFSSPAGAALLIPADLGAISSSELRRHLHCGEYGAISDLLPSEVLEFIRHQELYTA